MMEVTLLVLFCVSLCKSLPPPDSVLFKLDHGPRYQYISGPDGIPHLVDLWVKTSDVEAASRYQPDLENTYILFTRKNPSEGQPMTLGDEELVFKSNYDMTKKTVVMVHGWMNNLTSPFVALLVPAYLAAADVNVIVVDWRAGAGHLNYFTAVLNTVICGEGVARFLTWFVDITKSSLSQFRLTGHSLGGHLVGIIGRNLGGQVPYISALDPASPGWISNVNKFRADDGLYTEVIHTNIGISGYLQTLGQVDFYPNGGIDMPGCDSRKCDHHRVLNYFAESLSTSGFIGRRCLSYTLAMAGTCSLPGTLQMGGLEPKTGKSGVYYLKTNAESPFSQG